MLPCCSQRHAVKCALWEQCSNLRAAGKLGFIDRHFFLASTIVFVMFRLKCMKISCVCICQFFALSSHPLPDAKERVCKWSYFDSSRLPYDCVFFATIKIFSGRFFAIPLHFANDLWGIFSSMQPRHNHSIAYSSSYTSVTFEFFPLLWSFSSCKLVGVDVVCQPV